MSSGWPFHHAFEVIGGAAGDDVVVCRRCGVSGFGGALWQRLFKRCVTEPDFVVPAAEGRNPLAHNPQAKDLGERLMERTRRRDGC